jgi:hypothetical protein
MLLTMYISVVFERFEMGDHLRWHAQSFRKAFFQRRSQTMGLADGAM